MKAQTGSRPSGSASGQASGINHYAILGVTREAGENEIKSAFRQKAKLLHPDTSGGGPEAGEKMRKLLASYKLLMNAERRAQYDRIFSRMKAESLFDYRNFLRQEQGDDASFAKLIFYELLQFEDDDAVKDWFSKGGLEFKMQDYLEREDWMDCLFMLSEELCKRGYFYEAFVLAASTLIEEKKKPYFRHFRVEVESYILKIVRLNLKNAVESDIWIQCLKLMLTLGFDPKHDAQFEKWIDAAEKIDYSL
jgi:curved DNA-binding protein CbpA